MDGTRRGKSPTPKAGSRPSHSQNKKTRINPVLCFAGGSEADYNLLPRVGSVLYRAKDWGIFGVIWLIELIMMNGSQMVGIGQERGYTGWNGRNWVNGGKALELCKILII